MHARRMGMDACTYGHTYAYAKTQADPYPSTHFTKHPLHCRLLPGPPPLRPLVPSRVPVPPRVTSLMSSGFVLDTNWGQRKRRGLSGGRMTRTPRQRHPWRWGAECSSGGQGRGHGYRAGGRAMVGAWFGVAGGVAMWDTPCPWGGRTPEGWQGCLLKGATCPGSTSSSP